MILFKLNCPRCSSDFNSQYDNGDETMYVSSLSTLTTKCPVCNELLNTRIILDTYMVEQEVHWES